VLFINILITSATYVQQEAWNGYLIMSLNGIKKPNITTTTTSVMPRSSTKRVETTLKYYYIVYGYADCIYNQQAVRDLVAAGEPVKYIPVHRGGMKQRIVKLAQQPEYTHLSRKLLGHVTSPLIMHKQEYAEVEYIGGRTELTVYMS
jgi:hypothetical protein